MGREVNNLRLEALDRTLERQNAKLRRKLATPVGSGRRNRTAQANPRSRRRAGEDEVAALGLVAGVAPTAATMGVCVVKARPDIQKSYIAAVRLPVVFAPDICARKDRW